MSCVRGKGPTTKGQFSWFWFMQLDAVYLIASCKKLPIIGQLYCNFQNEADEIGFVAHKIQELLLTTGIQVNWDRPAVSLQLSKLLRVEARMSFDAQIR